MEFTAKKLAEILSGTVDGNPEKIVTGFSRIENGKSNTLCFFANPKYEKFIYSDPAGILIVKNDFKPAASTGDTTFIRVEDPYVSIATLLDYVSAEKKKYRRHRSWRSRICCSAKLGKKVYVGDFAYIGKKVKIGDCTKIYEQVYIGEGCTIGHHCVLYPGVKIYPGMTIGNNVILHAGVVIGSDGFGFAPQEDGSYKKIEHTGDVIIEDDVEIGANSTVDKSQIGSTIIRKGVKIDNHVQVAHNVELGENTVCCAQVGIAGSTHIGKNCVLAGQVGIAGHLKIHDGTKFAAQSGMISNTKKENGSFMGTPAIDFNEYMRSYVVFRRNGRGGSK